jgi:hypothetical protein
MLEDLGENLGLYRVLDGNVHCYVTIKKEKFFKSIF